jgi:hypothetical protein
LEKSVKFRRREAKLIQTLGPVSYVQTAPHFLKLLNQNENYLCASADRRHQRVNYGRNGCKCPYIGEWSNMRGETLVITSTDIQFLNDKPVSYRAIPRATEDSSFKLQITARGPIKGSRVGATIRSSPMKITHYLACADVQPMLACPPRTGIMSQKVSPRVSIAITGDSSVFCLDVKRCSALVIPCQNGHRMD